MKRKRKPKDNFVFMDMMLEMIRHGCKRGAAFGAIYGVLMLLSWENIPPYRTLLASVPFAMMFGLPFGAIFGVFAGCVLGIMNGLLAGILFHLLRPTEENWNLYRSTLAAFCGVATLVGGVMVFDAMKLSVAPHAYFPFVVAPAMIAAIVLAHVSQRAADRYIGAAYTME